MIIRTSKPSKDESAVAQPSGWFREEKKKINPNELIADHLLSLVLHSGGLQSLVLKASRPKPVMSWRAPPATPCQRQTAALVAAAGTAARTSPQEQMRPITPAAGLKLLLSSWTGARRSGGSTGDETRFFEAAFRLPGSMRFSAHPDWNRMALFVV